MAAEILDLQHYYGKLARKEPISEEELVKLVKMASHFQKTTAYLASCQAATLEGLPSRTSKSERGRHVSLCESAAKFLQGDDSPIRYPEPLDVARDRCLKAVEWHSIQATEKA